MDHDQKLAAISRAYNENKEAIHDLMIERMLDGVHKTKIGEEFGIERRVVDRIGRDAGIKFPRDTSFYDEIHERMYSNLLKEAKKIKSGKRFHSVQSVAAEYGVSSYFTVKVFWLLRNKGLIEVRGRAYFVC